MDKFLIKGPCKVKGTVNISGSKNASLPILAASILFDEMVEIKKQFSPEFRNRLDAIVSFDGLSQEVILRVVDKFLIELEDQLQEKKVEVRFSNELKKYLVKNGFDPLMGARPMSRLIQDKIKKSLADEILFGKLSNVNGVLSKKNPLHQFL